MSFAIAEDEEFESPYIKLARQEGMDLPWWQKILGARLVDGNIQLGRLSGGKLDDITVLVARVSEQLDEDQSETSPAQEDSSESQQSSPDERLEVEADAPKDTASATA
jgi:protein phosphatase PTC7